MHVGRQPLRLHQRGKGRSEVEVDTVRVRDLDDVHRRRPQKRAAARRSALHLPPDRAQSLVGRDNGLPAQARQELIMATILIVDAPPSTRQFLTTLLGYGGHRLLEAGDGAAALGLVRADRPDLIITDILMPTM